MSATARSVVYLAAMAHRGLDRSLSVALVEVIYVSLTAGIYAGMQQKALALRSRGLGNFLVVLGVPGLSQAIDFTVHHFVGAAITVRASVAVTIFALVSALFHLYVMRNGVFLTGHQGHTLGGDFRRIPGLLVALGRAIARAFTRKPEPYFAEPAAESEAAL
jgi:hypothetical protein